MKKNLPNLKVVFEDNHQAVTRVSRLTDFTCSRYEASPACQVLWKKSLKFAFQKK